MDPDNKTNIKTDNITFEIRIPLFQLIYLFYPYEFETL